jgi:hypothetical protein
MSLETKIAEFSDLKESIKISRKSLGAAQKSKYNNLNPKDLMKVVKAIKSNEKEIMDFYRDLVSLENEILDLIDSEQDQKEG